MLRPDSEHSPQSGLPYKALLARRTAYDAAMFDPAQPSVFFSHSSMDAELVAHVSQAADAFNLNLYIAEHETTPGARLSEKVSARLEQSWAVLVLITSNSVTNAWVNQEIGMGVQARKLVVPLVSPDVAQADLGALTGVEYYRIDPDDPMTSAAGVMVALARQNDQIKAASATLALARQQRLDMLKIAGLMVALGILIAAGTST